MSLNFDDARLLDALCYDLKLGDYPRGLNRALINNLYNGFPPYTEEEVEANQIEVNVNFLEGTRLLHDARAQFSQAFLKPGRYFSLKTDYGSKDKRSLYETIVSREMNRIMKRSLKYFETMRSKFGLLVLHGVSPCVWQNQDSWCPKCVGIEDALVPSNTLVGFENLPFFVIYRSFTGYELAQLVAKRHRDPGWNMPLVRRCLKWVDSNMTALMGSNWPEIWAPEKMAERIKGDGGFYATDQLPTIDCFDIYGYVDSEKESGWVRRIILDSWSTPQATSGGGYSMARRDKMEGLEKVEENDFLYTSGKRKIADSMQSIASFQFADLSAVAPFRYHSVRSLGFLLYAVCHMQNRLRGKFNEAVFEALMQYFKVKSGEDVQRALKLELVNKGFIDDTISPVPAADRWQVNSGLVELGLNENRNIISENSAGSVQNTNFSRDRVEKTRFQVMAEVNAGTSMLSAALMQAYQYQAFEYREIKRRFMRKDSYDPEVKEFRAACLRQKVPEKLINADLWEVDPTRVMGAGNKTLEMAIAEQLMQWRQLYDPSAQRDLLRDVTLAVTDDPDRAERMVPDQPKITNSIHDAQLAAGALMMGLPVSVKDGINRSEYCEALMADMAVIVGRAQKNGNMATSAEIRGLQNMAQHIATNLQLLAEDEQSKDVVRSLQQQLQQLMNLVKAFAQRLAQAAQQNGNGNGMDPKAVSDLQAKALESKTKIELQRQSHAQRMAQRQVQFEHELEQQARRSQLQLDTEAAHAQIEISKSRMQSMKEGGEQ